MTSCTLRSLPKRSDERESSLLVPSLSEVIPSAEPERVSDVVLSDCDIEECSAIDSRLAAKSGRPINVNASTEGIQRLPLLLLLLLLLVVLVLLLVVLAVLVVVLLLLLAVLLLLLLVGLNREPFVEDINMEEAPPSRHNANAEHSNKAGAGAIILKVFFVMP